MQWKAALWVVVAVIATTLTFQYHHWSEEVDRQHSLPIAWCPNYDSVRVHRVNWTTRTNVYVRTTTSTCGDRTAVTFGSLR